MAKVLIYTTPSCGYCVAAKRFLTTVKHVEYEEIDVAHDGAKRAWLVGVTGQQTVPQIFIGERSIGGYTDMRALDASGQLDPLLRG